MKKIKIHKDPKSLFGKYCSVCGKRLSNNSSEAVIFFCNHCEFKIQSLNEITYCNGCGDFIVNNTVNIAACEKCSSESTLLSTLDIFWQNNPQAYYKYFDIPFCTYCGVFPRCSIKECRYYDPTLDINPNLNMIQPFGSGPNFNYTNFRPDAVVTEKIKVYFQDILTHLIHNIKKANIVIGCVAWLTHPEILKELAKKEGVQIIIQKEDFLRPDSSGVKSLTSWYQNIFELYNALPKLEEGTWECYQNISGTSLNIREEPFQFLEPIRCVGISNNEKKQRPNMHHKFLIFCKTEINWIDYDDYNYILAPYAVWTGSFNFSFNATRSLENAIVIEEPRIVRAYYEEFIHILSLSELLDWESSLCNPEGRFDVNIEKTLLKKWNEQNAG